MAKTAVDEQTGLVFDLSSPEAAIEAQLEINRLIKSLEKTKLQIRDVLMIHDNFEYNNHVVKVIPVQRMTYDPTVLRNEIQDEDLLWQMFSPNKTWIDNYLKENLEDLGKVSTVLRKSMIPTGKPYTTVRIERLVRDDN